MDDTLKIPEGVGPHEGRELELMLSGDKPLACFSDVIPPSFDFPEEEFAPYVRQGKIKKAEFQYLYPEREIAVRKLFYARSGEEWRIDRLHEIYKAIFSGQRKSSDVDDREIGKLLGYNDNQIDVFLKWQKSWKRS